jgi:hypothetical protein
MVGKGSVLADGPALAREAQERIYARVYVFANIIESEGTRTELSTPNRRKIG